jgi:Dullard-like phosphatase family protein
MFIEGVGRILGPNGKFDDLAADEAKRNLDRTVVPPKTDKKRGTLVLDMDETLLHTHSFETIRDNSKPYPLKPGWEKSGLFPEGPFQSYAAFSRRPGLDDFIKEVKDDWEIIIFTSALGHYADAALDTIDPKREWSATRTFRPSTTMFDGRYVKGLSVLKRDLSRTVLIDNDPWAFCLNIENGIPIMSYPYARTPEEWKKDRSFELLARYLEGLIKGDGDFREAIRDTFKARTMIEKAQKAGSKGK